MAGPANRDRLIALESLGEAKKRAGEILLHLERAIDELRGDPSPAILDRIDQHLAHAHTKTTQIKQAASRGFRFVERMRVKILERPSA